MAEPGNHHSGLTFRLRAMSRRRRRKVMESDR
jgi:hypothetical protein